jgi:hypothetical protein
MLLVFDFLIALALGFAFGVAVMVGRGTGG